MKTLFNDPVHWAASAVASKTRFVLSGLALSALIGLALFQASQDGWRSAAGMALLLICLQFYLLYAMRSMYLRVLAQGSASRDPA